MIDRERFYCVMDYLTIAFHQMYHNQIICIIWRNSGVL